MIKNNISKEGWRPHAVYEILDINRQTLFYWRDCLYPKTNQKVYSTYELLLFLIIKTYTKDYGIKITRLKIIDWHSMIQELSKLTFSKFDGKILKIDLRDHSFKFISKNQGFDVTDGHNSYINIESISKRLINRILEFGS
jgi:hypothetical protein